MSDIKRGDLIYVIRSCSGKAGMVAVVTEISGGQWICSCGLHEGDFLTARLPSISEYGQAWHPLPWLRRIPPLAELGEVEHDESIPA